MVFCITLKKLLSELLETNRAFIRHAALFWGCLSLRETIVGLPESLGNRFRQAFLQFLSQPLLQITSLFKRQKTKAKTYVASLVPPNDFTCTGQLAHTPGQCEFRVYSHSRYELCRRGSDLHPSFANVHSVGLCLAHIDSA